MSGIIIAQGRQELCLEAISQITGKLFLSFKEAEEDGVIFDEKMRHLTSTLKKRMQKASARDGAIAHNLKKIDYEL